MGPALLVPRQTKPNARHTLVTKGIARPKAGVSSVGYDHEGRVVAKLCDLCELKYVRGQNRLSCLEPGISWSFQGLCCH